MTRPLFLDLFCGAGGAAMGYHQAGFDVIGVDIKPQPHYPFPFIQRDVFELELDPESHWTQSFVAIHASPPCQRWLGVPFARGESYPDLIGSTRDLLRQTGLPYVIENVPGAPLDGFVFCGSTFDLPVVRHRRFEVRPDIGMVPSMCRQKSWRRGTEHRGAYPFAHGAWRPAWRKYVMPEVWPWMTLEETHDAIPPAYTQFIGEQLLEHLARVA
jgi:DNA (cytosine-5)-methyltransferase 1